MSNPSLITRERAARNLAGFSSLTTTQDKLLDSAIAAASDWIRAYCRREFIAKQYDELYDGNDQTQLLLKQYPLVSIERVACAPETVLEVKNTSTSNQRATVAVTDSGLALIKVASGVTTTDTSVTFASNVTLTAVVTAVDALGSGWDASLPNSDFTSWPSADLRPQGAYNAADSAIAKLKLHTTELSEYDIDEAKGILSREPSFDWDDQGGEALWYGGRGYWRIVYTAGFTTVPEAVQEAAAEMASGLFQQAGRDPGLSQEQVIGVVFRTPVLTSLGLQPHVKTLLAPYRKYT